jgi:hypothetical protein
MGPREIAHVTGLPLYIFSHVQTRDSLGVPHRRVQKLIRFDRDEVMGWARRCLQDAKDQGVDAKADPSRTFRPVPVVAAGSGFAAGLMSVGQCTCIDTAMQMNYYFRGAA